MITQELFEGYNLALKTLFIPDPEYIIYGNSFTDPNNEVFNKRISDIKQIEKEA